MFLEQVKQFLYSVSFNPHDNTEISYPFIT